MGLTFRRREKPDDKMLIIGPERPRKGSSWLYVAYFNDPFLGEGGMWGREMRRGRNA
jgi:hypothetical protein